MRRVRRRFGAGSRCRAATAAVVLISGAFLSGCGSSYTRSDFIARANAICTNSLRQARAIPPPTSAQPGAALSGYLRQLVPVVQGEYSQLRRLPHPPGTAAQGAALDRWLKAVGQEVDSYRMLATSAEAGDSGGVTAAEAALTASPAGGLAASIGLRACTTPGATVT